MLICKKITFLISLIFLSANWATAQLCSSILQWSDKDKLTKSNFVIKTNAVESMSSFAQFSIDYKVGGFNFLTKNFNQKVRNSMITEASWIDTTVDVNQSLLYQQTLFDICEIYTRKFRQALRSHRKKLIYGMQVVEELNTEIVTDFTKRRIKYDTETKFGSDKILQKEWEMQIQKELKDLAAFAYDK